MQPSACVAQQADLSRVGEVGPRWAALDLLAAAVVGMGDNDRSSEVVQTTALKAALKAAVAGAPAQILVACAGALQAVAQAGAVAFWTNTGAMLALSSRLVIETVLACGIALWTWKTPQPAQVMSLRDHLVLQWVWIPCSTWCPCCVS